MIIFYKQFLFPYLEITMHILNTISRLLSNSYTYKYLKYFWTFEVGILLYDFDNIAQSTLKCITL